MTLKLRYERMTVTRSLATKLLADLRNDGNRKLKDPHIWTLGEDMAAGVFNINPQPIIIREDDKRATLELLDGQHRLIAASNKAPRKGVSVMVCFVCGNDSEIVTLKNTIDSGHPRSISDRGGFNTLGVPQGFLEAATRLFEIIGQAIDSTNPDKGYYGWMKAPKASYSACLNFHNSKAAELIAAHDIAKRHLREKFKGHRVNKQYLALTYLVALMNGAEINDLDDFAAAAADPKSVLSCKLQEVWREGHSFSQKVLDGSRNGSGIQYLLMRDLLIAFMSGTLTSSFNPVLVIDSIDATTLSDFDVN